MKTGDQSFAALRGFLSITVTARDADGSFHPRLSAPLLRAAWDVQDSGRSGGTQERGA
jgi:hypothetical protein